MVDVKKKKPGIGQQQGKTETVGQGTSGFISSAKTGKFIRHLPGAAKAISEGRTPPSVARGIRKGIIPPTGLEPKEKSPFKTKEIETQFKGTQQQQFDLARQGGISSGGGGISQPAPETFIPPLQKIMDYLTKLAPKDQALAANQLAGREPMGNLGRDALSLILGGQSVLGPTGSGITAATKPELLTSGIAPGEINPLLGATSRDPTLVGPKQFLLSKNTEFIINKKNAETLSQIKSAGNTIMSNQMTGNTVKAASGINPSRYTRSYQGKGFSTLETWTGPGPYNRAVTNTKTATLTNSWLKNLVLSAGGTKSLIWKTFMVGAIGSYPISTSLAVNERGDAAQSLIIGMRDAKKEGDLAARDEMGEMLLDITEPSLMNTLKIAAPIINYPIAAIQKWRAARKVARVVMRDKDIKTDVPEFDLSQEEILAGQQIES